MEDFNFKCKLHTALLYIILQFVYHKAHLSSVGFVLIPLQIILLLQNNTIQLHSVTVKPVESSCVSSVSLPGHRSDIRLVSLCFHFQDGSTVFLMSAEDGITWHTKVPLKFALLQTFGFIAHSVAGSISQLVLQGADVKE